MNEPEFYRREDGLWDWRIRNKENGQIVGNSGGQGFTSQKDARRGFFAAMEGLDEEDTPEA